MKNKLVKLGFEKKVTEFETSLNRAAEKAAQGAATVFLASIRNMTVSDGMAILKGADTAATHYLKQTTTTELYSQYKPVVKDAINQVKVTQYWDPLVKKYNKIPGVKKQNPDLEDYVTKRAMAGVEGKCRILPGIDIGIPTGRTSRKASPDDTEAATRAALEAGADGVILSRKYSEMRLANLEAAGKAVRHR